MSSSVTPRWLPLISSNIVVIFIASSTPTLPNSLLFPKFHRTCSRDRLFHLRLLWHGTWLHVPDVGGIFCNGAVARELSRARNVQNGLACPFGGVGIQSAQRIVRLEI